MVYRRSKEIEERLETALRLIASGRYATPELAKELRVSIPTVSRCVTALRERGHPIHAEKARTGWRYVLREIQGGDLAKKQAVAPTRSRR